MKNKRIKLLFDQVSTLSLSLFHFSSFTHFFFSIRHALLLSLFSRLPMSGFLEKTIHMQMHLPFKLLLEKKKQRKVCVDSWLI